MHPGLGAGTLGFSPGSCLLCCFHNAPWLVWQLKFPYCGAQGSQAFVGSDPQNVPGWSLQQCVDTAGYIQTLNSSEKAALIIPAFPLQIICTKRGWGETRPFPICSQSLMLSCKNLVESKSKKTSKNPLKLL